MSTTEKVDIVVTAQTDGATRNLKETAGATEQLATATKAAGAEQAALTAQLQRTQKASAEVDAAAKRVARAQDEATMTARAHGAASQQAADAQARLTVAMNNLKAAEQAATAELSQLKLGLAASGAAADKASPALAKITKETEKLTAAAERQAAELKRAELSQLANAKASGKGAEGFSLLGAAGGKLMAILGPAALGATLAGAGAQLAVMAEKTLQYETAMRNLPFALEGAKKATHGLISEQELAIAASQAVALGVVKTQQEFDQLASDASKIALKLGTSSGQMLGDLTTALGRGSAMILDNAGIILKVSDANERYAASVGKTVSELNEAEKKLAFQTAAMEAIRKSADAATVAYDGNAAAILKVKTAWGDAMASMERATVNAVGGTITLITGHRDELIKLAAATEQTVVASDKWAVSTGLAAQATAAWAAELLLGADALEMVQRIALDEQNLAAAAKLTDQERAKRDVLAQEADFAERQAKAMERIGKEHESFLDEQAMRSIVYGPEEAPKTTKKSGAKGKAKDIRDNGDIQRARIFDGRDESNAVAWDAMAAGRENAAAREAAAVAESVAAQERAIDSINREMEAREAAGMQAEDLIERRIAAERRLAAFQRRTARDDRTREAAETRMMKVEHDKRLRDLRAQAAAEQKEHEKRQRTIEAVAGNVQSLGTAMVGAMQAQAEGSRGAIALELESWLKGVRNQMIVKALVEVALAAGAVASFNYPAAAAHGTAAGLATAAAVAAGTGGAIMGASNEARGLHDSPGRAGGSGGSSARGDSPGSSGGSGRGGLEHEDTPVSREAARRDVDMPRQSAASAGSSQTINVTVNNKSLNAHDERTTAREIVRLMRKAPLGGYKA